MTTGTITIIHSHASPSVFAAMRRFYVSGMTRALRSAGAGHTDPAEAALVLHKAGYSSAAIATLGDEASAKHRAEAGV